MGTGKGWYGNETSFFLQMGPFVDATHELVKVQVVLLLHVC